MKKDRYEELKRADHQHLWHPFTQMRAWLDDDPIVIERGEGAWVYDTRGRRYLHRHSLDERPAPVVGRSLVALQPARDLDGRPLVALDHDKFAFRSKAKGRAFVSVVPMTEAASE